MFVILTYDIGVKRVAKVMKTCRKYLQHEQKSVFEGMITYSKLTKLLGELKKIIDCNEDKICVYKIESLKYTSKEKIGKIEQVSNII